MFETLPVPSSPFSSSRDYRFRDGALKQRYRCQLNVCRFGGWPGACCAPSSSL
jgi:hypothetical protein